MRRLALPIALSLVALLGAASAQGVPAAGPGYVASFQVSYDSPPFPDERLRVTATFEGEVCGDPSQEVWDLLITRTGVDDAPPPGVVSFSFAAENPALITSDTFFVDSTEVGKIEYLLRFTPGTPPVLTPEWRVTGDIQNVVATPSQVAASARTLPDCPAAQPPPPPPPPPGTVATGDRSPGRPPGSVKVPGSPRFVPVDEDQPLLSATIIDVSQGKGIRLTDRSGDVLDVYGVRDGVPSQAKLVRTGGFTELQLTGGSFKACAKRSLSGLDQAKKPVRRLWAKGKGKFRTKGRYASAAIRGTWWLTADFCDRTLVQARQGSMLVRDFVKRKNVVVRAPQSYAARKGGR